MSDPSFDLLPRIARLLCRAVDGVDDCGVTVARDGRTIAVAFSSDLAALNDELQYTAGAGPCLEALADEKLVESTDLTEETRWGRYPPAAVGCGVRSVLSLPIAAGPRHGVLTLSSQIPHRFSERDRQACGDFAGIIADVLMSSAHLDAGATPSRPGVALVRRSDVAQAVGVYMARHRCGPEDAFQLLLSTSRDHGEDVHATAVRVGAAAGSGDG